MHRLRGNVDISTHEPDTDNAGVGIEFAYLYYVYMIIGCFRLGGIFFYSFSHDPAELVLCRSCSKS